MPAKKQHPIKSQNTEIHPKLSATSPSPYELIVLPTEQNPFRIPAKRPELTLARINMGNMLTIKLYKLDAIN